MRTHLIRAAGAVAAAALAAFGLAGAGAAATAAAPGSAAAGVPAGFEPVSASFRSPASGVVLGAAPGCEAGHACRALLAATSDGGTRWHLMTAPGVWLPLNQASSLPQVSDVVFASRTDGWLYYQYFSGRVWVTHDGGAHWRAITLPGDISTMAASAGTVYAVVQRAAGDELYRSPAGKNAWARVGTVTGSTLAVAGKAAWLGTGFGTSGYLWTTADGVHWARSPFHCPAPAAGGPPYSLAGIAAASRPDVAFLCAAGEGMYHTSMKVLVSVNGGRTVRPAAQVPQDEGDVYGFAVPPGRPAVITIGVVTPGLDYLYRSANGGKAWAAIAIPGTGGGPTLSSLSYVSPTVGWVVAGMPSFPGQLLRTSDAGRTWHAVRF